MLAKEKPAAKFVCVMSSLIAIRPVFQAPSQPAPQPPSKKFTGSEPPIISLEGKRAGSLPVNIPKADLITPKSAPSQKPAITSTTQKPSLGLAGAPSLTSNSLRRPLGGDHKEQQVDKEKGRPTSAAPG